MSRALQLMLSALALVAASPSNVLLLVVDDLRPELGVLGGEAITPNLDALAAHSVVFSNSSVQLAVCNPSRSSFLTGRRPDTLRVWELSSCWRTNGGVNATSLPEHFRTHGYVTGGQGKVFHPVFNNATNTTDDVPYSWTLPYFRVPGPVDKHYSNLSQTHWAVPDDEATDADLPDGTITSNALQMLKNMTTHPELASKPFFLAVGLHRPHLPWVGLQKHFDLYPNGSYSLPEWPYRPHGLSEAAKTYGWDPESGPRHCEDIKALNISFPFGYIPTWYGAVMKRAYLACTSATDYNMGLVLNALVKSGRFTNTTIVFIGDHGWQLGDHGEYGKKTTWSRSTIAPMMIKPAGVPWKPQWGFGKEPSREPAPRARAHVVSTAFVEFAALYPTLAELSGVPVPPTCPKGAFKDAGCVESRSFAPAVKMAMDGQPVSAGQQKGGAPSAAISQYPTCMHDVPYDPYWGCHSRDIDGQPRHMGYTILAVQDGREWRHTRWVNFSVATQPAVPRWDETLAVELYDRTSDPNEDTDVSSDPGNAKVMAALRERLEAGWRPAYGL